MNSISAAEITRMRTMAVALMTDTCQLGTSSVSTSGAYPVETLTYGSTIACGFKSDGNREAADGSQAPMDSATLRLPLGTSVKSTSHVKVVSVRGTTLSQSEEYRVIGVRQGPTCLTLSLERLVGGGVG